MGLDIWFTKRKSTELGYFRKVNFLVKFFESIGLDVKNQESLEITKEDVKELLQYCEDVLKDHSLAKELLPTMEGFFFGNTEYDEDYFYNVEEVRDFVKYTLLPAFEKLDEDELIYFNIWY